MQLFSRALHRGPVGWGGCDLNPRLWMRPSWHSALTCHLLKGTFRPGQPVSQAAWYDTSSATDPAVTLRRHLLPGPQFPHT